MLKKNEQAEAKEGAASAEPASADDGKKKRKGGFLAKRKAARVSEMEKKGIVPEKAAQMELDRKIVLGVRVGAVVLAVIALILIARFVAALAFQDEYDRGLNRPDIPYALSVVPGFLESYVPYYDLGCVHYRNEEYAKAESAFKQAVSKNASKPRDCDIRVNLALSICYQIDFDNLDTDEAVNAALERLYEARGYLVQNKCASDGYDYHDLDAQQLKEDIDRKIAELMRQQQQNDDQSQDQQDQNQGNSGSGQGQNQNQNQNQNQGQNGDGNDGQGQNQNQGQNGDGTEDDQQERENQLRESLQQGTQQSMRDARDMDYYGSSTGSDSNGRRPNAHNW